MTKPNAKLERRPGSPVETIEGPVREPARETDRGSSATGGRRRRLVLGGLAVIVVGTGAFALPTEEEAPPPEEEALEPPAAAELDPTLDLPGKVHERVDRWIQRFLTDQRVTFEHFLSRESLYGELIRRELRDRGMPRDLLYVAMIESGFSTRALSPRQASGLWQFMLPTARDYGLEVTEYVDERRDPVRATEAALSYLEELHLRFGSWYLAAAAYNAGPNRVARILARHGREGADDDRELFWTIVDHLPPETREYVPKFIAASLLAREAERHGFRIEGSEPYAFERVWVPGRTSLEEVARAVDASLSRIRALNPHLLRGVTPPGTSYGVRVPPGTAPRVVAAIGGRGTRLAD